MAQEHRFYHIDWSGGLMPGKALGLDANGMSPYGATYANALQFKSMADMNADELREAVAEEVRIWSFPTRPSRLRCCLAFLSPHDARAFAAASGAGETPAIIEVLGADFVTLDRTWLTYDCDYERRIRYMRNYWCAEISNHNPSVGPRRPPVLEVLLRLPAATGAIVEG